MSRKIISLIFIILNSLILKAEIQEAVYITPKVIVVSEDKNGSGAPYYAGIESTYWAQIGRNDSLDAKKTFRTILNFDLSEIPDSAIITAVSLTMSISEYDSIFKYEIRKSKDDKANCYDQVCWKNRWEEAKKGTILLGNIPIDSIPGFNYYHNDEKGKEVFAYIDSSLKDNNAAFSLISIMEDSLRHRANISNITLTITYFLPKVKITSNFAGMYFQLNSANIYTPVEIVRKVGTKLKLTAPSMQTISSGIKYFDKWEWQGKPINTPTIEIEFKKEELIYGPGELKMIYSNPLTVTVQNNFPGGIIKINDEEYSSPKVQGVVKNTAIDLKEVSGQLIAGYERVFNDYLPKARSEWKYSKKDFHKTKGFTRSIIDTITVDEDGGIFEVQMRKNFRIFRTDSTEFEGTLDRGIVTRIVEENKMDFTAPVIQTINNRKYQFSYWTDNFSSGNTISLIPRDNTRKTVFYKMLQASNNYTAFSNSGQTKFLTTEDDSGVMAGNRLLYESSAKLWLETKNNAGQWRLGNGGKPLNNGAAMFSASFDPNSRISDNKIIYQTESGIKIEVYDESGNKTGSAVALSEVSAEDMKPVMVSAIADRLMAVWKGADGLFYRFGCYTPTSTEKIFWYVEPVWIDGTDGNSDNPTIASGRAADLNNAIFHIAWQQGTSKIIRKSYKINNTTAFNTLSDWGASQITATGAGCSSVKSPVITVNPGNNAEYRLAFIGYKAGSDKAIALFNNQYSAFGSTVTSIGINCIDNKSVIAFSDNGTGMVGRVAEVYYYGSPIKHTGTIGKIKMSPAVSKANASVMALNTNSLPYSFNKSNTLSLLKASDIKTGKEGIIAKGDAAVYFRLGDIESDGLSIEFDNKPDSIGAKTAEDIAERTTTLPFTINDASKLKFSVYYGALDSAKAYSALSETDKAEFEAELIDSETKEVLGSFEKTAFTKTNLSSYEKINYIVNTEGIGARKVRLRLKAKSNFGETVSISNIYEESGIQKQDEGVTKQAALNSDAVVKEYALEQNYPNPFNPATTIRYALPKDGAVRLTIYNLLGQEVTTLVNEYKLKGRYEVKFDASNLSSGMYIYRIESGSFSDSKRMMLVK